MYEITASSDATVGNMTTVQVHAAQVNSYAAALCLHNL
jgi:hypothetical protein